MNVPVPLLSLALVTERERDVNYVGTETTGEADDDAAHVGMTMRE